MTQVPALQIGNSIANDPFIAQATSKGMCTLATGQVLGWFQAGPSSQGGPLYAIPLDLDLKPVGSPILLGEYIDRSEWYPSDLRVSPTASGGFVVSYEANDHTGSWVQYSRTVKVFDENFEEIAKTKS